MKFDTVPLHTIFADLNNICPSLGLLKMIIVTVQPTQHLKPSIKICPYLMDASICVSVHKAFPA